MFFEDMDRPKLYAARIIEHWLELRPYRNYANILGLRGDLGVLQ